MALNIFRKLRNIAVVIMAIIPAFSFANSNPFDLNDSTLMVVSCQEALTLFENSEEISQLKVIRTSLSEAMRAGYCIGAIEHYLKSNSACSQYRTSWKAIAQLIAERQIYIDASSTVHDVVQAAACD